MSVSVQMRVTVPDKILDDKKIMAEIQHTMQNKTGRDLFALFQKTIEGWDTSPVNRFELGPVNFRTKHHFGPISNWVRVSTSSKKYAMVNEGTPPHPIPARPGRLLRFRSGYRAATSPRRLSSMAPMRFGDWWKAKTVQHPGIREPRKFDETIAEKYLPVFERDIQEAVNRGAKK